METLFYGTILMIIVMIGLGFANRVWIVTGDVRLAILGFFTWGMVIGDRLGESVYKEIESELLVKNFCNPKNRDQ